MIIVHLEGSWGKSEVLDTAPPALYAMILSWSITFAGPGLGQFAKTTRLFGDIVSCPHSATNSLGGNEQVSKQENVHLVCNLKILNKSLND